MSWLQLYHVCMYSISLFKVFVNLVHQSEVLCIVLKLYKFYLFLVNYREILDCVVAYRYVVAFYILNIRNLQKN